MPLDGAGGRHEDAGGEGEVGEALQHQVDGGGQWDLQGHFQAYHKAAEKKEKVCQTEEDEESVEDCRHLL